MAEDKKAFVVYADWESQFDLLSDEEAGKLIKHIFSYVNDKNPEFDNNERLLIMAFEPIKKQLKRDLKRYENTKSERSNSGVIGNLKRWHIDLYKMFEKKEITLEEAQKIANARNKSLCDNSDTSKSQTVANIAVTDIVTDTVIDIVKETVKDTDISINSVSAENKFSSTQTKKNIEDRLEEFRLQIEPFKEKYSSDTLNDFWRYWTEKNSNGKKMRFEMQKVFDVGRRLITWSKNENKNFNGKSKSNLGVQSRQERVEEVRELRIANQQALADRLSKYTTSNSE